MPHPGKGVTMQSLLLGIAALSCPVGMGLMMRGQKNDTAASQDQSRQHEMQALRTEIEQLKSQRASGRTAGGQ